MSAAFCGATSSPLTEGSRRGWVKYSVDKGTLGRTAVEVTLALGNLLRDPLHLACEELVGDAAQVIQGGGHGQSPSFTFH